jgi:sporulation protein YlmC with PRC-barrel domain
MVSSYFRLHGLPFPASCGKLEMNKMKIRFLLIVSACIGLAACSAVGPQQAQPGTPGALNNAPLPTQPGGPSDLAGQTAAPGQAVPPATSQPAAVQPTQPPAAPQPPAAVQPTATSAPAAVTNPTLPPAAVIPATGGQISLDQLMDYRVVDSSGFPLGEIKDAVISQGGANSAAGQIPYLVMESDTREDFYVPIPWQSAQVRPDTMTVTLPVTAAQFANAPAFNKDFWPVSFANQPGLTGFWANPAQAGASQGLSPGATGAQSIDYVRASDVTDLKVVSPQGVKMGDIEDLAINWQANTAGAGPAQFNYVIMKLDDNISPVEPRVPLPWRLVHPAPGAETLILNIAPNILTTAPNFMKGMLPNLYTEPMTGMLNQFWSNK